jgi:AraC family transcriptional regulator, regulatory protein of adaptative response / methylated-DNA-[protein]-cysteine methyltransferase
VSMSAVKAKRKKGPVPADARWNAVLARDAAADGQFYYAVKTTGIYCRPSCPSRRANRENVLFFASQSSAKGAGFRPCKRCGPEGPARFERHAARVAQACRSIEAADNSPGLTALAREAGLSPYHFHRIFKSIAGLTPKRYAAAHRAKRVRDALPRTRTVTEAVFDAGFNSGGRFYATSERTLGMTPSNFRSGGANADIRFAIGDCSLGSILVAATARGVCAILLGDDPQRLARDLQDRFPRANLIGGDAGFERWVAQVVGFVEAPSVGLGLPLDVRGSAFQQRVWHALQKIPAGDTATYADIARRIGAPKSVRAVALACGATATAVAIPCHRVIRSDGALSGYRWGVERKRALLKRESKRRIAQG